MEADPLCTVVGCRISLVGGVLRLGHAGRALYSKFMGEAYYKQASYCL